MTRGHDTSALATEATASDGLRDLPKKVKLLCEELLVFREPIVRRLTAGGRWIRTFWRALAEHLLYLETEYHQGHRANFSSADLAGRDFSGLNLRGIKMARALLSGADFTGAHLQSANLTGAIAEQACFDRADLSRARLSGANLISASLEDASLV